MVDYSLVPTKVTEMEDSEKPESWLPHLFGFIAPLTTIAGNMLGDVWVVA